MRKCLYLIAILIAIITFSCDTTDNSFEGAVPDLYSLITEVDPEGSGRVSPSEGEYVSGTRVELRAIPEDGYVFDRWGGALSGSTNPISIVMSRDRAVMAYFIERDYPLTIEIIGEGIVNEEVIGQSEEEIGEESEEVNQLAPESREIPREVDGDIQTQMSTEDLQPQLNRESTDTGAIYTEIGTASQEHEAVTVRLTAEPAEGWYFDRWEGDLTGDENPAEIVVDEPKTVTAVFEEGIPGQVNLDILIEGEGDVEADPNLVSYEPGTEVTLTAIPESGWYFLEWDGDLTGSDNPAMVIMDEDKEITARFELPGAPAMNITQQPSETVAGMPITPAPVIEVTDDQGDPVENLNITAALNENSLASTATATVATDENGVASFDNLIIETAGTDYVLTFDADETGVSNVSSGSFEVIAAEPDPANSSAEVPDGTAGEETVIVITVLDPFDNPVDGEEDNLTVTVSGSNNATPEVEETGSPGIYQSRYTPLLIGTDNIGIELDGTPIDGSPYESNVTVSTISSSNSAVTADPDILPIGNNSTVTVELRDEIDNLVSGLLDSDFSVTITGNATSGEINESESGLYTFTVTNNVAETVSVTVAADGVTLDDQPEITFESGDASNMIITGQPAGVQAGQVIAGPPAVRLTDSEDNPVPGASVNVTEQSGQSFESGQESVSTDENGYAIFEDLVITVAGQYNLVFSAAGVSNLTSNAFTITAADADPANSEATVPNGSAGDATQITITVRDAFGNRVAGVAGDLNVMVSGGPNAGATVSPISEEGDGIYTTGYSPVQTGDDEITIELDGLEIQGSPFTSSVITSDAEDVTITQQPLQTTAGQPVEGPPAVEVVDDLGNPVEGVEVTVSEEGGQPFTGGTTTIFTDNNGLAEFGDLIIQQAGTYNLVFNAIGASENAISDPFNVVAAEADNLSEVSGNNQTGQVDETIQPFVVQLEDAFGNPVPDETVTFAISSTPSGAAGQQLSIESIDTDADGQASTTLTLGDTAGTYEVTASSSAGIVIFSADAEAGPASSFEFDTISSPQTAGQSFSISLTAFDSNENIAAGYNGTASLTTTAGTINPATIDFTSGTASTNVTVSDAGSNQTITATEGSISGTSNTFDVESGGVSADNSTVSADPGELQAGQSSSVTIDLRDGSNNPVSSLVDDDFSISLTGSATAGTVTEGTAGTYNVNVDNETAETITVTVTANGITLSDNPSITFTAADPASLSIVSGNNQTGTVSSVLANPFVVQVTDQYDNPVEGESVNFAIDQTPTGAGGQSLSQTSVLTDGSGEASSVLTLGDTPGTYTVDATSGTLTAVTFTADAEIGEASQMTVTVQPSETTAGEVISPAPAVTVTDDLGNGVQGISVTVSEQSGEDFDAGTLTQQTNASGIAEFTDLIFETAQSYTLTFNAAATGVSNVNSVPFDVIAATGAPTNTTADVPNGAAGESTTITITVLDEFNNRVSGSADDLTVSVTDGPNEGSTFTTITDNGNGIYSTSYMPEIIGTDEITITLNSTGISGSPFSSNVTTSDVSASNSTVSANPTSLQAGSSSEVTVVLRDGSNNPISGLSSSEFNISVSGNGSANTITETATDGTYTFDVTNTTAEDITVSVTATGTTLNDTPQIIFTAADPDLMLITTEPDQSVAGQPIEGPPAVRITDEYGNPVPGVGVVVTEQGGASFTTGSTTNVNTNDSGFSIFDNVAIETVGQYNLVFAASGVTNRTSNAFDVIAAAGDPASTTATVPDGTAGQTTVITINVTDEFGNDVSGVASDLAVSVTGANTENPVVSDTGTPGEYTASYTPANSGTDNVAITLGGVGISGSPYSSEVSAGSASSYSFDTIDSPQTAGSPFEITVTALDDNSNTATGYNGTATLTTTAGSIVPATAEFTSGVATLNVEVSDAGTGHTITAEDGALSATSNSFTVEPGPVSSSVSSAGATSPHTADGTDASTVTVTLRDGNGNEISGLADADFTVDVGTNAQAGPVGETAADGTYEFTVTNSTAETVTVVITADGITLEDQPEIVFQAGAASDMSITVQPSATTAGTAISPAPAVEVTDGTNPVSGVGVTAILSSNNFTGASTVTVITDGNGIAEFTNLIIESAGTGYTITFDADAAGVANVGSIEFEVTAAAASALNEVSGSGQSAQINQTLSEPFVVEVVDDFGNPVSGESVSYTIVATPADAGGQSLSATSVNTDVTGRAESTLTLGDKVGTYGVDANWSTQTVNFTADAESGDVSAMSVSTQPETTTAGNTIAGPPAVLVTDAGGNPVSGVSVSVSEQGGYTFDLGTLSQTTNNSGVASFEDLVIQTADTYTLVFSTTGVTDVSSDPFTVDPGPVSSSVSSAGATSPHTADGTDASTVTVTLRDGNGNEISGLADADFTVDVGTNAQAGPVGETAADGTYEFTVTNSTAETVTVLINADGITLEDQPEIEFVAG